jgi:lincosamide nucleotidyltransferase A/C/D/E
MIWRLPVPRRLRVFLSQLAYRNPAIPPERVLETMMALELAEIEVVVIGGWGVDALIGRQLRPHADLDLIADRGELDRAAEVLRGLGYETWNHDHSPGPIGEVPISAARTFRDGALRVVELHGADLRQVDSVQGSIEGHPVACLSADSQLRAQYAMGKAWTPRRRSNQRRNIAAVLSALRTGL